jgi:hypothetical protein
MISVVFFETTVLIASSIREVETTPKPIEHRFYDGSQGLIRFAASGKIIGITSHTVEEQTEHRLEKALKDTIEECMGDRKLIDEDYERFSTILDKTERKLRENVRSLDRLATLLTQVRQIKTLEVLPMYGELAKDSPPRAWTFTPKLKPIAIEVTEIQWRRYANSLKYKEIIPDEIDMEVLSEAIILKRERFPSNEFFITSADKHFSGSSKDPWNRIPIRIKEQFKISCCHPNEIINLLR